MCVVGRILTAFRRITQAVRLYNNATAVQVANFAFDGESTRFAARRYAVTDIRRAFGAYWRESQQM